MTVLRLPYPFCILLLCAIAAPLRLWSQTDGDSATVVRIVNVHSKVTALHVASTHSNDTIVRNLGFPAVSQEITYQGTLTDTLAFVATAPEGRVLGRQALNIVPGRYYAVLVLPIGGQALIQPYYRDSRITVPPEKSYVQFLHGAADVPALLVSLTDAKGKTTDFTIPGFGTLTAYDSTIAPGAFTITIKALADQRMIYEGRGDFHAGAFQTLVLSGLESTNNVALGIFDQDNAQRQDPVRSVEKTSTAVAFELPSSATALQAALSLAPQPLHAGGSLSLSMPAAGTVSVDMYDLSGKHIATLCHAALPQGTTRRTVNLPSGLAEGIYMLTLSAPENKTLATQKVWVATP